MTNAWPMVPLSKVLTQYQEYFEEIESPYAERARKQLAEWGATD